MQLSLNLSSLLMAVLAFASVGKATPVAEPATFLVSHQEMLDWIATTDANLTFIGEPVNPLAPRAADFTTVTYCSRRIENICGGKCFVYSGGPVCLNAPDTQCISATNNVGFCTQSGCGQSCNQLSNCGTHLEKGFCYTPGTESILVSSA